VNPIIEKHPTLSGAYQLRTEQWLPRPIDEVFDFFGDAYQLEAITPPWLHFHVVTPKPIPMVPGTLIDYKLRLHGLPVKWRTEISEWEPPRRFVDRQLIGPYHLWHHLHEFEEHNGGTLVRDTVDYKVPGGGLIHWLLVKRDLTTIFKYRHERMQHFLGEKS
jgi:ligand-binding SRPBCC domain-containing protein